LSEDETRWMAAIIEIMALTAALVFAWLQAA
jgi:hypothetical protein